MFDTYIAQDNDTLDSIANKFNTSVDLIKKINNDDISLEKGTMIFIPKYVSEFFDYYSVLKGDTLYKIANDNNIDPGLLSQLNGLNMDDYIYPNQVLLVPRAGTILYITSAGDTLDGIVNGIKADMNDLITQNKNIYLQPEQLIVYKYK